MNDRGDNGGCSDEVEGMSDMAEIVNVIMSGIGWGEDMFGKKG